MKTEGAPGDCPKSAFRQMYVPICDHFQADEGSVVGYVPRIRLKMGAKWVRADDGNEF